MRITEQEQEIRRRRMLHAAFGLFSKHGIDGVSMARIAKAANVSTKSLFRYFDSKATLLRETQNILWREIVDYISERTRQAACEAKTGLDALRTQLYGFEPLYQAHSNYILFAYEYKTYLIRNKLRLPSGIEDPTVLSVSHLFLDALERGQSDGSITAALPAMTLFLQIWYSVRHVVEQLVVFDQTHYGAAPWENVFPYVVERILVEVGAT